MGSNKDKNGLSSYEKGINNILSEMEKYEELIWAYVLSVNSKFYSKEFPSTQIAKIILDELHIERTRFPIFHKVIRVILQAWTERGFCERIVTGKKSRSNKTKEIYRFNDQGLAALRARFIHKSIDDIRNNGKIMSQNPILRTREKLISDLGYELLNNE